MTESNEEAASSFETPDLTQVLQDAETIAVVGCSKRESRTSHQIARALQKAGYRVIPVNPYADDLLGETCYPDVQSIPADVQVDVVNVFRRPEHTAQMVRDAAERAAQTGRTPVVWTQLGVSSDEAEREAAQAGLPYVRNRCIKVEHAKRIR